MAGFEAIQFHITLTRDPRILKQLKINKMQREDDAGIYYALQFDSQEFKFRPGVTFTVGKTVGNALIRNSAVLIGNSPLSDPYLPFVEKLSEITLGQADVKQIKKSQFACPICNEDQKSGPKLARHLMDKSAHKSDEVEGEEGDENDSTDGDGDGGGKPETKE